MSLTHVMVPVIACLSGVARALFQRVQLPIPPLWLACLFPANYAIAKLHERLLLPADMRGPLSEVKETTFEILFLVLALHWLRTRSPGRMRSGPAPGPR